MTPNLSRLTKIVAFLALVAFVNRALDRSQFRASLLNQFVDSVSTSLGIGSRYVDLGIVTLLAAAVLWTLTTVCQSLTGMLKR